MAAPDRNASRTAKKFLPFPVNRRWPRRHKANTVGREGWLMGLKSTQERSVAEGREPTGPEA